MNITFIEFNNLKLDFSNNYFQTITFSYLGNSYNFNIYPCQQGIYIYSPNFVAAKIAVNKIIKTTSIDIVFCQENLEDSKDLNLDTLFTKYKLGVISYV